MRLHVGSGSLATAPHSMLPSAMPDAATARRTTPVRESMATHGLWVFESRHDEAFFMTPTRHPFLKLLYLREGTGTIEGDWGRVSCKTGDCVLVPAGLRHRVVDDPAAPISLYGLGIASQLLSFDSRLPGCLKSGIVPRSQVLLSPVEPKLRRLLYLNSLPTAPGRLAAVAVALEILAQLALGSEPTTAAAAERDPDDDRSGRLVDDYLQWLQSNFFEAISLDEAARACRLSRRHFTALFRQRTGTTWLAYVHRLRVRHAITLLQQTDHRVASIAFRCGFEDLSTFYRVLRRSTGKKPSDFRR